jgi:hypothetical protein
VSCAPCAQRPGSAPVARPLRSVRDDMAGRLQRKICIVTGTGSGIGCSSALMFAREGARVVGADMGSLHPCDLTPSSCEALIRFALDHYGRLDVLLNNGARAQLGGSRIWPKSSGRVPSTRNRASFSRSARRRGRRLPPVAERSSILPPLPGGRRSRHGSSSPGKLLR